MPGGRRPLAPWHYIQPLHTAHYTSTPKQHRTRVCLMRATRLVHVPIMERNSPPMSPAAKPRCDAQMPVRASYADRSPHVRYSVGDGTSPNGRNGTDTLHLTYSTPLPFVS